MAKVFLRHLAATALISCLGLTGIASGHQPDAPVQPGWISLLELRVNDSFSFNDLVGVSVAWKGHKNARWGWRLGLTPELQQTNRLGPDFNAKYRQRALIIEGQRLRFIDILKRTQLCIGLGLVAGMRRITNAEGSGEEDVFQRVMTETSKEAGLIGTLSVEYTLASSVVLGVEYGATAIWSNTRLADLYWDVDLADFERWKKWRTDNTATWRKVALTLAIFF